MKADTEATTGSESARRRNDRKGLYYTPPTNVRLIEGVKRAAISTMRDQYEGTAEALVSAGLLPLDKFPGHDGIHSTAVSYRPAGVTCPPTMSWYHLPGYMHVQRRLNGTYWITLNVSAEERAKREMERKAEELLRAIAKGEEKSVLDRYPSATQLELLGAARKLLDSEARARRSSHLRLVWSRDSASTAAP